jgi:outer membrane protein insertion porin family
VKDVKDGSSAVVRSMAGRHQTSSLRLTLRRDTRDSFFNTTRGLDSSASVEYAGGPLGGTNYFTRYIANSGWYFPLFWGTTGFINGKIGYVNKNSGGDLPLYEKFYLGGINSVRGFKYLSISPTDLATGDKIGGEKMVQFNVEYIFPIVQAAGIKGVVFYDAGNVYPENRSYDLGDLRSGAGFGIRWYSPMGPLRLEWGKNLNPRSGEDDSVWEFSIGTFF